MNRNNLIKDLINHPDKLLQKKPFTRGMQLDESATYGDDIQVGQNISAELPDFVSKRINQEDFLRELDPYAHKILFDSNIPSICVKLQDGSYNDIQYSKMAIPFQLMIKNKKLLHLTALNMSFTLLEQNPTEKDNKLFIDFKKYWQMRNQDAMKVKFVDTQLSYGDAGLLYYFDYKGEIKSRIISFKDGYVICSHNDPNGDRMLESIYYTENDIQKIDSYDDKYHYHHELITGSGSKDSQWKMTKSKHGFDEIPLITKRGDVAWNAAQSEIESYEVLYNVFNAIQKRWGWGLLYIKGKMKDTGQKIAGSVVINDTNIDGKGDAKFLTPPTPQGTIETLDLMYNSIQLASGCTFLLPKDIRTGGDLSGVAVQLTQSLDIQTANQGVTDWQNVANKMVRLFKQGLAIELVKKKINKSAITDYTNLDIHGTFKVWKPYSETEYNTMLEGLTNSGILSKESAIELNTVSKPDELSRVKKENKETEAQQMKEKEFEIKLANQKREKSDKNKKDK